MVEHKHENAARGRMGSQAVALLSACLLLSCALLSGCARVLTEGTSIKVEDAQVEKIVTSLRKDTPEAQLYTQVVTAERRVSILFEGYSDEPTMMALSDLVREKRLPIVLFLSGIQASDHPAVAKYAADAGCEIGNYTLSAEKNMQENSVDKNARQIYKAQETIKTASGYTPVLLRCNGTEYTPQLLQLATLCGLTGAVEPNAFLNHRSFETYDNALNFVRKLERGSIISIKLGQELDADEYKEAAEKLEEKPAIDPEPTIRDENLDEAESVYENLVNVVSWLLDALAAEQYSVVSLARLEASRMSLSDEAKPLDEETLAKFELSLYPHFVTEQPLGAQQSAAVDDGFFHDTVFIGDSVTLKLADYVNWRRKAEPEFLGTAQFLAVGGLGVGSALWQISGDSLHPEVGGVKMTLEEAVAVLGAKKVYIMLGANDIAFYDTETYLQNYKTLLYLIRTKSPSVKIFIQSITPTTDTRAVPPTSDQTFAYDLELARFCLEYGYTYVDVASALRDENGYLPVSLCSDAANMGMHFTDAACEIWLEYLRTHTS